MLKKCKKNKPYIFVSYSSKDKEIVHRDVEYLQKLGYNLWIDDGNPEQLARGDKWKIALRQIRNKNCELVLFYVSENSLSSLPCRNEIEKTREISTKEKHNGQEVPIVTVSVEQIKNFELLSKNIAKSIREAERRDEELDIPEDEWKKIKDEREDKFWDFIEDFNFLEKHRRKSFSEYQNLEEYISSIEVVFPSVIKEQRKSHDLTSQSEASRESEVKVSAESKSMSDSSKEFQSVAHQSNEIVQESVSAQHLESVQTVKEERRTESSKVLNKPQKSVVSSDSFIADVWANASSHDLVEQWGLEARKPQKDFVNVVSKILKDQKFSHYFDWQVSGTSLTNSLRDSSSQKKLGAAISEHESEIIAKINERVSEELADSVVNSLLDKAKPAIQIRTTALSKNFDVEQVALWFLKATDIMMSVLSEYC